MRCSGEGGGPCGDYLPIGVLVVESSSTQLARALRYFHTAPHSRRREASQGRRRPYLLRLRVCGHSIRRAAARPSPHSDRASPLCSTSSSSRANWCLRAAIATRNGSIGASSFPNKTSSTYSPVTNDHVRRPGGMSVAENLRGGGDDERQHGGHPMLASFGGPTALTAVAPHFGRGADKDRSERDRAHEAAPGDPRDTTTPNAHDGRHASACSSGTRCRPTRPASRGMVLATRRAKRLRGRIDGEWRVGARRAAVATERPRHCRRPGRRGVRRSWWWLTSTARRSRKRR